ncbi:MAG TPA: MFS transporter [Rhizobiaceae bacterium]|nr:MFS transporter [Rhizobiaceae bacterium]
MNDQSAQPRHWLGFALIVSGTILGIAGTDLVLPAIPLLPEALDGDIATAQLVLASFVAGAAAGLLLFGALGARYDQRHLLTASLAAYAAISLLAMAAPSIEALITLRFLQGAAGAAAAVFAPGIIRAMFGDARAISALGFLGSVESLTPAFAPIVGVALVAAFGWTSSFAAIALLSALLAVAVWFLRHHLPRVVTPPGSGGYADLLRDATFLRYCLSQAFTLGALLVIVFGAPSVFVNALGGTMADFVTMQLIGIGTFVVAANLAGRLANRYGAERMVMFGTLVAAAGTLLLLAYALAGGTTPLAVAALFVPVNVGLGLRGPAGFHCAILAARGDDARGAALVIVAILLTTALGTAAVAPFIAQGLLPLTIGAAAPAVTAVILLVTLPPLAER